MKNKTAYDTHKKSMLKTLTWRTIAITTSILVIYAFTRSFAISFWATLTANIISSIQYYFHERIWSKYEI